MDYRSADFIVINILKMLVNFLDFVLGLVFSIVMNWVSWSCLLCMFFCICTQYCAAGILKYNFSLPPTMWIYLYNIFVTVSILAKNFGNLYERFRGQELKYLISSILDHEF